MGQTILDHYNGDVIALKEMTYDGKEYTVAINASGTICTVERLQEFIRVASEIYENNGAVEDIQAYNSRIVMQNRLDMELQYWRRNIRVNEKGLYILPSVTVKYKKFSVMEKKWKKERKWSIMCQWCNTKVSNEKDDGYYTIVDYPYNYQASLNSHFTRTCSERCAELLWKETMVDWIKTAGFAELFDLTAI